MEIKLRTKLAALAGAVMLVGAFQAVSAADSAGEAIRNGDFKFNLRYRLEFVDQDGFSENAQASTLRSRLIYSTEEHEGWQFFIEAENTLELGLDNFNSGAGTSPASRNKFPVVADPNHTEINQAYLNYGFNEKSSIRLGRQRILIDNQRYVGGVGWRQNEQTYDAVSLKSKVGDGDLFYSFVANVNRIFGDDVTAGDHDQDTHLLNFAWPVNDKSKLTFYYYDIDNDDAAAFSTSTLGAHFKGKTNIEGDKAFNWGLEFATQDDNGNNPVDFSANYFRVDVGLQVIPALNIFAGWEMLEGDDTRDGAMFRTPLATLHAFNGWADRFLTTPAAGIEDAFFGAKGKLGDYPWQVIYHDFQAESGSGDFGSELDASISFKPWEKTGLLLKAAFFDGEGGQPDVTKLWLMLSTSF